MKNNNELPEDIFFLRSVFYLIGCVYNPYFSSIAYPKSWKGQLEESKIRYDRKITMYHPELGSTYKPLVLESTGVCHPLSFSTLKSLASKIATNTGKLPFDISTCSIRLQRSQGSLS